MSYYIYRNPDFNKVGCTNNPVKRMEEQQGLTPWKNYVIAEADDEITASHLEAYYKGFYRAKWDKDIYMNVMNQRETKVTIDNVKTTFKKSKSERYFNIDFISKKDFIAKTRNGVIFDNGGDITEFSGEENVNLDNIAQSSQFNAGIYFVPKAVTNLREKLDEKRMDIIGQNGNDGLHYEDIAGVRLQDTMSTDIVDEEVVAKRITITPGFMNVNPCPDWRPEQAITLAEAIVNSDEETAKGKCHGTYIAKIRNWATERGLYEKGDAKTQMVKLVEEVGETAKAILKDDQPEIKDGLGDVFVVLVNLAHLAGYRLEDCIEAAYNEIKDRKGGMKDGTFVKE